jgi:hypothetical protein
METMQKTQKTMERTAQTMGNTLVEVIDKLSGTKSGLKLSFQNLTLETGILKASMNGAVVLEAIMAQEIESST